MPIPIFPSWQKESPHDFKQKDTLPETNGSHLKMDGWKLED